MTTVTAGTNATNGGWMSYLTGGYFGGNGTTATAPPAVTKTAVTTGPTRTWADTFRGAASYIPVFGRYGAGTATASPPETTGATAGNHGVDEPPTAALTSVVVHTLRPPSSAGQPKPTGVTCGTVTDTTGFTKQKAAPLFRAPTTAWWNPSRYLGTTPQSEFNPERFGDDTAKTLNEARSAWKAGTMTAVEYAEICIAAQETAEITRLEQDEYELTAFEGVRPFEVLVCVDLARSHIAPRPFPFPHWSRCRKGHG